MSRSDATKIALEKMRSIKTPLKPVIRERKTHSCKSWPISFNRIITRQGDFDVRFAGDRDYRRGDILRLCEWSPVTKLFTGRVGVCHIRDIMRDHEGLEEEYIVMGLFFEKMEKGSENAKESEEWP